MAIETNDTIYKYATQTEVTVASPASVANGAFSLPSDVIQWSNSDDAPLAMFVLVLEDLSAAATAGDTVDLYCKPLDVVNTTGDHQGPNLNLNSIYLGSFLVDSVDPAGTGDNYVTGPVALPGVKTAQDYAFYIFNNLTTVSITDWQLWITPVSYGPHA